MGLEKWTNLVQYFASLKLIFFLNAWFMCHHSCKSNLEEECIKDMTYFCFPFSMWHRQIQEKNILSSTLKVDGF